MNKEEFKKILESFTENNDFVLNPDEDILNLAIESVLKNEEKNGLKLCPCRLRDGTREGDLKLLCPCNFKSQEIWTRENRCWCGLFIKKE